MYVMSLTSNTERVCAVGEQYGGSYAACMPIELLWVRHVIEQQILIRKLTRGGGSGGAISYRTNNGSAGGVRPAHE